MEAYKRMLLYSRVPPVKSFFNLSRGNPPHCVNETDNIIGCSCTKNSNGNITVCSRPIDTGNFTVAQFQSQYANMCIPVTNETAGRRHRRSVPDLQHSDPQNVVVDDAFLYTPPLPTNYTLSRPIMNISTTNASDWCNSLLISTPGYTICSTIIDIRPIHDACVIDIQVNNYILFKYSAILFYHK